MADIGSFIGHVLWNWWTVLAGFMIAVEPVTRFLWHGYDEWAAKWLSAERRRPIARLGALAAFLIANYLAFHDVSEQLRAAQSRTASTARHLTSEERLHFVSDLRSEPISGQIEIMSTCDECEDYGQDFRDALSSVTGLSVAGGLGMFVSAASRGIKVYAPSSAHRYPLALRFARALDAAALHYEWAEQNNLESLGKDYVLVVIGRPWR